MAPEPHVWDEHALADPHRQADKAVRVEAMFDAIAPTYERVNRIATLGRDAAWRRRAVRAAGVRPGDVVLDLCCGTGDMIRAFAGLRPAPARIIGLDFSANMLRLGRYEQTGPPIHLLRADALRLPLSDASVDVVSCAFGVRNFQCLQSGLEEMRRVLRPGGRVIVLEFVTPENAIARWGYNLYTEHVLPVVGALFSRDRSGAYRYLPRSIRTFETRHTMTVRMQDAGLARVTTEKLNFGGVVLYRAERP